MDATRFFLEAEPGTGQILRATVTAVGDDGTLEIVRDDGTTVACDVLNGDNHQRRAVALGDVVLAWYTGHVNDRGVILGRIVQSHAAHLEPDEAPDELVIEAKHSLTLRVGDGSITIREDGKILIKGKDLVSHATRLNRIKGGAVQIN